MMLARVLLGTVLFAALPSLTPAERRAVVDSLARQLQESYVDAEAGEAIANDLRRRAAAGEFDRTEGGEELARLLNVRIRTVTTDPHLGVRYSEEPIADPRITVPPPEERQQMLRMAAAQNFGFEKVERLPGNVGFLELNGFFDAQLGGETAGAAMAFLANCDAVIIDLRYNSGGVPGLGQLLSTYFFGEKPVHLHTVEWREKGATRIQQFWTLPFVAGRRLADQPLFILTSDRTISAAESFAYSLQSIGRATIVGEVTRGGGHAGGEVHIAEHFAAFIPTGRAVNPITKTNWEGKGIQPDVRVDEEQAASTAHRLALETLREGARDDMSRRKYQGVLDELFPR